MCIRDSVDAVTPLVYVWGGMSFSLETGKYKNEYTTLVGVIPEDFKKLVDLKDGTFFSGSTGFLKSSGMTPTLSLIHI